MKNVVYKNLAKEGSMSEVFSDNEGVFKAYNLRNQTNIINSD